MLLLLVSGFVLSAAAAAAAAADKHIDTYVLEGTNKTRLYDRYLQQYVLMFIVTTTS